MLSLTCDLKNINEPVNITKEKQTSDLNNKLVVISGQSRE